MKITDNRKRGWFWAQNEIFNVWGQYLKPNGIAVYLCLCRHANQDYETWPGYGTIGSECGMSRRTAIRIIRKLINFGLIACTPREKDDGSDDSNLYTLLDIAKVPLPNFGETEEGSVRESLGWCQTDTPPSVTESLPLVSESHPPSDFLTPEGNPIKETNKRNTTTTEILDPEIAKSQPEKTSSSEEIKTEEKTLNKEGLIFDFALESFTAEQKQRATHMLKDTNNAQDILDQFSWCLLQGKIREPLPAFNFLSSLVKRATDNTFTPTHDLAARRHTHCPYCNGTNQIQFTRPDGTTTQPTNCQHNQHTWEYIQAVKRNYKYELYLLPTQNLEVHAGMPVCRR